MIAVEPPLSFATSALDVTGPSAHSRASENPPIQYLLISSPHTVMFPQPETTPNAISTQSVTLPTKSAREAKNTFGLLIDSAIADPVVIERYGGSIVVVVSYEEFERTRARDHTEPCRPKKVA